MSHLPAAALSYEVVVAEYWLGLRAAGLMLSPLDAELVRAWERRGYPVAVVCRGLRRGLEDALRARPLGTPPPRALRAFRLAVEDEWRAYRSGRVGEAEPPPDEAAAAARRLSAARAAVAREAAAAVGPRREAWGAAGRALAAAGEPGSLAEVDAALARADAVVLRAWLAGQSREARAALGPRCRARAGERPPWTRRAAYRSALRAHLADAAREAGLLPLRGLV